MISMIFHGMQGILVMVQIDHLSGELLGGLSDRLIEKGAQNVQMIPTLSKKSRPAYLLLIDTSQEHLPDLEEFLVVELGVTGWHRIPTEHIRIATQAVSCTMVFPTQTNLLEIEVYGKRIEQACAYVRPEHDVCRRVQKRLSAEHGVDIPLHEVERLVEQALNSGKRRVEVDVGRSDTTHHAVLESPRKGRGNSGKHDEILLDH
jgi:uncharacterized protein (DUF111 family)